MISSLLATLLRVATHRRNDLLFLVVGLGLFGSARISHAADAATEPAAQGAGVIVGSIFELATGRALNGARVGIEDRPDLEAQTDVDGAFRLVGTPLGSVNVIIAKDGFRPQKIESVWVSASVAARVNVSLDASAFASAGSGSSNVPTDAGDGDVVTLEEMKVTTASALANSTEAFTALRRSTSVSVDTISTEELKKFIGADVSAVVIRIPGVSLAAKGKFAVIRGMSERYNVTTLNGIQLPSSDPERQNVELDLFPTRLLDGMVVYKSFSADLPGSLSGGGVDLRTTSFPTTSSTVLTLGVRADEGTIKHDEFLSYRTRGSADLWAEGSRDRLARLPTSNDGTLPATLPANPDVPLTVKRKGRIPWGGEFSLYHGNTLALGGDRRLGYNVGLTYNSSYSSDAGRVNEGRSYIIDSETYTPTFYEEPRSQYSYLKSEEQVSLGALGTLAFRLTPEHQFNFTGFWSQVGIDTAEFRDRIVEVFTGPYTPEAVQFGVPVSQTGTRNTHELRYRERNLTSLSLSGKHVFPALHDGRLTWSVARNTTYQNEPDTRSVLFFQFVNEAQWEVAARSESSLGILRTWREVRESQDVMDAAWEQPVDLGRWRGLTVKVGGVRAKTDRNFDELVGGSNGGRTSGALILENQDDVSLYADVLFRSSGSVVLKREISAGYVSLSLPLFRWLKVTAGERFEKTVLQSDGFGANANGGGGDSFLFYADGRNLQSFFADTPLALSLSQVDTPENRRIASANINQIDALPAFGLAISPAANFTIRLNYARTLARPSLRELGNYFSYDEDGQIQHGNGFLQLSEVRSSDVRLEYFFHGTDLIALSGFYKEIDRPIEKVGGVFLPNSNFTSVDTWFNNPNTAEIKGVEFEVRKSLEFLGPLFRGLSIGGNATMIDATIAPRERDLIGGGSLKEKPQGYPTQDRRLYDQPRWLANADITFVNTQWGGSWTLAYNASDRVLTRVDPFIDQYRDRVERLDLTWGQRISPRVQAKLSVKNLLDPERRWVRDPDLAGDSIVDRRYRDGRAYSLSLSIDFGRQ